MTWVEIDLDAIAHNINEVKKVIKNNTKIMAVIKSNAYGHGIYEVARTAINEGVERFAVSNIDEGLFLRSKGVNSPILIFGYTPKQRFMELIENNLTQSVFSVETAEALSETAVKLCKNATIHIKIDSGLGRIGFPLHEKNSINEIVNIFELPGITIEGAFTHFASAGARNKTYAYYQLDQYLNLIKLLENRGLKIPIKHVANSAAILDLHESHLNMVRPGVLIYGLYPTKVENRYKVNLREAFSLKTRVIFSKDVPPGECVGYGCKCKTSKPERILTVPVGFGDGIPSRIAERGEVIIGGKRYSIVGGMSMNYSMINAGNVRDIAQGDEVVIIGSQGSEKISLENIAQNCNVVKAEITCSISDRIKKVYIKNGQSLKNNLL